MVYSVLADYTILSQLYAVLFNLLDSLTLRHFFARDQSFDDAARDSLVEMEGGVCERVDEDGEHVRREAAGGGILRQGIDGLDEPGFCDGFAGG